jgi:hypothetical protein
VGELAFELRAILKNIPGNNPIVPSWGHTVCQTPEDRRTGRIEHQIGTRGVIIGALRRAAIAAYRVIIRNGFSRCIHEARRGEFSRRDPS